MTFLVNFFRRLFQPALMICSAPGKVIISGEHSVVYGKHVVVTAINLRCFAEVVKDSKLTIESELGKTGLDFKVHPYISYAVKRFENYTGIEVNAKIRIKSEIPISSGLGSSAAVTVSTLAALNEEFSANLEKEEIFELARLVELDVQGKGSGTDPFVSTFGGGWLLPEKKRFDFNVPMIVVDSGESSITAEMVEKVAKLRSKFGNVVDRIFDAMDAITLRIFEELRKKKLDIDSISQLFRMNQCMLKAIGVSTEKIDRLILDLESRGVASKITGAGGGGCILGIGDIDVDFDFVKVQPEKVGVRVEDRIEV